MTEALASYVTGFVLVALYTQGGWGNRPWTAAVWFVFVPYERLTRSYHDGY